VGRREVESCEVESSALDFNACREGFWRALALMIGGAGQGELLTNTVSGSPGELPVSENPAGSS